MTTAEVKPNSVCLQFEDIQLSQSVINTQVGQLLISRLTVSICDCGDLPGGKTMESLSSSDVKLFNSSLDGDTEGVIAALAQGGRVTVRHPQGFTPFLTAVDKVFVSVSTFWCS